MSKDYRKERTRPRTRSKESRDRQRIKNILKGYDSDDEIYEDEELKKNSNPRVR